MNVKVNFEDDLDEHLGFFENEEIVLDQMKDVEIEIPEDN